jgi:hypothetical protein
LLTTAITVEKSAPFTLPFGLPAYVLGGPIVHGAHGYWGRAAVSLVLRGGLPLAGAALGASGCGGGSDCANGVATTAILGMAIASLIDLAALSWEPATPAPAGLQASVSWSTQLVWLGAGGTF